MAEQQLQYSEHEDAILVKYVIDGEPKAFEALIYKYERLVNSIVYKMVGQTEDREDICQEIFLRVYKNLSSFKFRSKLSTWIGNIAFNLSVNYLKKKKNILFDDFAREILNNDDNELYDFQLQIESDMPLPDESLLNKENVHFLLKAIEELNPIERTVLQLFHQEELSLAEISVITNQPVNTIKSHLFRARKNLKGQLIKISTT